MKHVTRIIRDEWHSALVYTSDGVAHREGNDVIRHILEVATEQGFTSVTHGLMGGREITQFRTEKEHLKLFCGPRLSRYSDQSK